MVKVSITLPNAAQITLEADESEIIHGVVGIVLRDVPRDLMNHVQSLDSTALQPPESEKGSSVTGAVINEKPSPAQQVSGNARDGVSNSEPASRPSAGSGGRRRSTAQPPPTLDSDGLGATIPGTHSPEQKRNFAEFCRSANPLGDMRRVVVAAEGASQILGMTSVDAEDLGGLFDLAGWFRPHNFTQTLRNAARDKFRWLERVPGRAGRYAVTEPGRSVTLGD